MYGKIVHEYGVKSTVNKEQLTSNAVVVMVAEQQKETETANEPVRRNGI